MLVRYVPTGKGLIVGAQGVMLLTPKALHALGASQETGLQVSQFEFFRVYRAQGVTSMSSEERGQLQSWVNNPGGGQRLSLESMSTVRSEVNQQTLEIHLRPTYLILAQVPLPQVEVAKKGEDPSVVKKRKRTESLRILETSWQRLVDSKYDQSLLGFEALLKTSGDSLSKEETDKAVFGRGLSRFHQVGCVGAYPDFESLQGDAGPFYADALYYGALCALDKGDTKASRENLEKLVALNNARYAEQARFYMGVVYEQEGEIERAESSYLDTIDFAEDESLIKMAKERVDLLKDRKAREKYEKKIFSVLANVGVGFDSNALSLPSSVQPADQGLETGASPSYLALLYLDAKNPWLYPLEQRFQYSFLMLGYTDSVIASNTDLQSHEVGANVEWGNELKGKHKITGTFGLSLLGKIASSEKYLTTYGVRYDLTLASLGAENALDYLWMHSLSVQKQDLAAVPSEPKYDSNAIVVTGSHKKKLFRGVESYGWGTSWEYKAAKGDEAKFAMLGPMAFYERELLWGKTKFKFSEEISLKGTLYHSSAASRKDYYLSSTSALAHQLGANYEVRGQVVLVKNFSSISDSYGYNRFQTNLSLTAFF